MAARYGGSLMFFEAEPRFGAKKSFRVFCRLRIGKMR